MTRKFKENKEKHLNGENINDIVDFANYVFEQVKLQQETRDRWIEIFISIVAGVSTFATFTLAFFSNSIKIENLYIIMGLIFMLTGVLGVIFYFLFLSQRINYKLHYKVLNEIQQIIINKYLSKKYGDYYPTDRSPFRKYKRGADFYALLIENVVVVVCFAVSCTFFLLYLHIGKRMMIIICLAETLICGAILRYIYYIYENKI